jgi:hypothetical protein
MGQYAQDAARQTSAGESVGATATAMSAGPASRPDGASDRRRASHYPPSSDSGSDAVTTRSAGRLYDNFTRTAYAGGGDAS